MGASFKKLQRVAEQAYETYVSAAADAVALGLELAAVPVPTLEQERELTRLRHRAGAHHAAWMAAERRAEQASDRQYA